jgi:hypothetical protein
VIANLGGTAIGRLEYQRPTVAVQPVRLLPRPRFLAGREELLAELDRCLTAESDTGPRTVVLCGLGGAGKTSLALEYAHRRLATAGVIWQFPAEDPALLTAGFADLAAQLGNRDPVDTRDPVASVHAVLAAFKQEWLLVFDNALDPASVEMFLPPAGRGQILVTSQNQHWPCGQVLTVPVLAAGAAAKFLLDRTGLTDERAAVELAQELGGLPLALEQAAAYIKASDKDLAGYLADFRRRRTELLARGEPAAYHKTVATAWSLAFGRIEESSPVAAGLLRLLACCAAEPVPLPLLLQLRSGVEDQLGQEVAPVLVPLLGDSLASGDAVAALRRYSLLTPAGDGKVLMHRLVQAATLDQMPDMLIAQWRQGAAVVINAAIPLRSDQPETWPVFAALLPHVQTALAPHSDGMLQIAEYLHHSGRFAAALAMWHKVVDARQQAFGAEHPDTLDAGRGLAWSTFEAGDPAAARDLAQALLPVIDRVLGPEHPDTLTARYEYAAYTGRAGDPAAARDLMAAIVPVSERVFGAEHPAFLIDSLELAIWTGKAGDPVAARDEYSRQLPIRERVFGHDHPYTLAARHGHADWIGETGDPAAARDLLSALVADRERAIGPDHPSTLGTRHDLAVRTGEAGDPVAARDQLAALLPITEQVLGPQHPITLSIRHDLAYWTTQSEGADAP